MPAATSAANRQQKEKKIIALKYSDGHPLTRQDLQYDLLHHIFADPHQVFTDPYPTNPGQAPQPKLTFRDLYLNTILHSPKCSRGPRDKALENQDFGTEFAKMSLLTNVGRINTTMACQYPISQISERALLTRPLSPVFPELRTQLRTYHPVPPLQKTDGNLQDAPRIKNILKDCYLPSEGKGVPSPSPTEILSRLVRPSREIRATPALTCRSPFSLSRTRANHRQRLSLTCYLPSPVLVIHPYVHLPVIPGDRPHWESQPTSLSYSYRSVDRGAVPLECRVQSRMG